MIRCPKCDFQQPKDQYCASCGVDMVAYAAKHRSALPIPAQLLVPLVGFAFAAAVTGYLIWDRAPSPIGASSAQRERPANLAPSVGSLAQAPAPAPPPAAKSAAPQGAAPLPPARASEAALASVARPPIQGETAASPPFGGVPANPQGALAVADRALSDETAKLSALASGATGSKGETIRLWVSFAQITRSRLLDISKASSAIPIEGGGSAGALNDLEGRIRSEVSAGQVRPLEASSRFDLRTNEPIVSAKGRRDETHQVLLGLTLQITPTLVEAQGVQLQIESTYASENSGGAIESAVSRTTIPIGKGQGGWLAGLLPRRPLPPRLIPLYTDHPVLKIVLDPTFVDESTEFVVLLQPR